MVYRTLAESGQLADNDPERQATLSFDPPGIRTASLSSRSFLGPKITVSQIPSCCVKYLGHRGTAPDSDLRRPGNTPLNET